MPYISMGKRKELLTEKNRAQTKGDFNYLFTLEYLKVFNDSPCYATLALIREASLTPSRLKGVKDLEDYLTIQGILQLDRIVARDLAFQEFYRRIGSLYEDHAKMTNGDLEQYEEAERIVVAKFTEKEVSK